MLTGQNLKDDAIAILENLYPEVELAFFQTGGHDQATLDDARETIERLQRRILHDASGNSVGYRRVSDLAAELVHLAYRHPEEFTAMFQDCDILWVRDADCRTPSGLFRLMDFYSSICDDHSFVLDPASETPCIKSEWQIDTHVPLCGPERLLSSLQEYRAQLSDHHDDTSRRKI